MMHHYPTLWHALKPSCDCAITQIRYLKRKKKTPAFISASTLSPPTVSGAGGAGVWPGLGSGVREGKPLLLMPLLSRQLVHGGFCCCICTADMALTWLGSGWLRTMQFLSLLCLRLANTGIFILRHQIQWDTSFTSLKNELGLCARAHRWCHFREGTHVI